MINHNTQPQDDPFAFLDSSDDDLDSARTFTPEQERIQAVAEGFKETCQKCRGTGRFVSYTGRIVGPCFTCKGAGHKFFRQPAAKRADNRAKSEQRNGERAEQVKKQFAADYAAEWGWIVSNPGFNFAVSMREAIAKYGHLTENQLNAVRRCMARATGFAEQRAERNAARDTAALPIDVSGLVKAFDNAHAKADASRPIASLKLRFAGFSVSPAKATSRNAGALYVKTEGDLYLGKISEGRFFQSRDCTPELESAFRAVCDNPKEAAIQYGRKTGSCSCCGRLLTNPESIELGIGPICAAKYGWN